MRRRSVALLHFGYWGIYLLLLVVVFATLRLQLRANASIWAVLFASRVGLVAIGPNVVAFYLSYGLLFPLLARRRLAMFFAAGSAICFGVVALVPLGLFLSEGADQPLFARRTELSALLGSLGGIAAIHMTIALVLRGFITWCGDRSWREELGIRTQEMELALLRARIDPHFLFNTLNNIDVLIGKDPEAASTYLQGLASMLRFVLHDAEKGVVPLARELDSLEQYIALERLRTAKPDFVVCEVAGDPSGRWIAPMVFVPFLENAFKHTAGERSAGAIDLRIAIAGERLSFHCRNRVHPEGSGRTGPGGMGSELMRRRLELLYPGRHRLEVDAREDFYSVRLTMELDASPLSGR